MVVGAMWVVDHVVHGRPIDGTAWIILGATLLRILTIGIALASVQAWGRALPNALVLTGLWGCAAAQIVYPATELVVKVAVLLGLLDLPPTGIGNMSATGWFNFSMAWLVFGVPGLLFVAAARSYVSRRGSAGWWPLVGTVAGTVLLFGIGWMIG
ncbi:UNVERIFIED_CONTAM: hypothetical protein LK11_54740 [Mumia flava]|uniref:hypothetical protein n=1 Tax=Mumia flava TaxID=1348852 RepID=UPI000574B4F5|nr:hypothetical protein [Mumia flava]